MSRRVVIGILVLLIVGVAGGTIALVISRLNTGDGDAPAGTNGPIGQLPDSERGPVQVENPEGDDDNDGLTNAEESLWGSDPNNPDTDGDSFTDGEEVRANRNPTVASPNDQLPEGFRPGQEVTPLEGAGSEPVAVGEFFSEDLDLSGGSQNLTEEYRGRFEGEDRNQRTLTTFVEQQPIITQLPRVQEQAIFTTEDDSPEALRFYLAGVGDREVLSDSTTLSLGLDELFRQNNPGVIRGLEGNVRVYQEQLLSLQTPPAANSTQQLLLAYTELVAATLRIIANWEEDPVKSLVAVRQLSAIDEKYFPLITQEIRRLEARAGGSS